MTVKSILGINPIFSIRDPLVVLTFNTLWFIDNIYKVVPLHSPELMSKFLNNITDAFILSSVGNLEHIKNSRIL